MAQTGIELNGFKEVRDMLFEVSEMLNPRKARSIFNKALKRVLKDTLADMKANTPVDSGFSKKNLRIKIRSPTKAELSRHPNSIVVASVGFMPKNATKGQSIAYFILEYGSEDREPLRIIRNASNRNDEKLFANLIQYFLEEVEKAAAKARKKAGL